MAAEQVKNKYPNFDLETELKNPKFVTLCQATNEDVMAAYEVCHNDEIIAMRTQAIAQQVQQKVAQSVATNASRPQENGLSGQQASTVVSPNFKEMSKEQLMAYAERMKRTQMQG